MNKFIINFLLIFISSGFVACSENNTELPKPSGDLIIKNETTVSTNFIGNGAQWGGFDIIESWTGKDDFTDADWAKLKERIDFMHPPFIRIMISAGWNYLDDGNIYNPAKANKAFHRMMQYCTDNQITVMFGEWGHVFLNGDKNQIDYKWMDYTVDYLDYLIKEKGYTCIKYYNMINEPNGDWSTTKGDYNLWKTVTSEFLTRMETAGVDQLVKLAGPDLAVFGDANDTDWVAKAESDFGNQMALYDIHSYATKSFVNGNNYLSVLKAYKNAIPAGKQIVVGEIGLKYYDSDIELQKENERRIAADPYASKDSNMFVYDGFYGVDVSDAIVQTMMAGFSGALIWDMDDAMYNETGSKSGVDSNKLKRWGFWNILGEEAFDSSSDEEIRPFFYPVSLLCRYFPQGSDIIEIELPNKKGLKAIAARKGDQYTVAIVNSNYVSYTNLSLFADKNFVFDNVSKYQYTSKFDGGFVGETDTKGFPVPNENNVLVALDGTYKMDIPGQSVTIFTNMI
ncbi:cellulase family glycosylhydrolase [Polaribacter sp. Q13]|uniref:cellulase family glycosylhydrolase n=1 Tax=Polaribacter sp. Q13 TaxID=2806551 RepID=UPI00193C06B1|nr:cellulase family glycosylhydrolase [Polaribacter sp. Q13]QVY66158.1 cellulase family glycosylhydrolase [Polaribacter sp. Q13]